ncbi:MAG: polar amino acid transporter, inner rane subunit [Anaerocolumna sp.]|jgi:putative glutamine transport system permease protein|nr:polar amino acid transporter, inner rane subunit [Anaerocolumna sp.]
MREVFSLDNIKFMFDGLKLTILIALGTIILSLFFGTILALIRTYAKGKWKIVNKLAVAYIELFRCTPNILWILFFRFSMKGDALPIAIFTFTLFTSAVVAEIVRGGLNAIPKGQTEAAESQGFHFIQILIYIILPQTYKSIIPALMSQVTTIIKDTAFLKAVDIMELTRNSQVVLASARGVAEVCALYGYVAFNYFILIFLLSNAARYYQKKTRIA